MRNEGLRNKKRLSSVEKTMQHHVTCFSEHSPVYYNKKKKGNEQDGNYNILKENEFDGFCSYSGPTRTLVGEKQFQSYKK